MTDTNIVILDKWSYVHSDIITGTKIVLFDI